MTTFMLSLCNVPARIPVHCSIIHTYNPKQLNTIRYYISCFLILTTDIQHDAVRMSQKNEINSAETTSRNSSSEESGEKKGTPLELIFSRILAMLSSGVLLISEIKNTPEDNIANIREKTNSGGEVMVATIHPIRQDDTKNIPKQDDKRQRNHRGVQKRTGDKKRHFYLGFVRRSSNRNDENGEIQRCEQNEYKSVIFIIAIPLYPRKKNKFHRRADFSE